MKRRTVEITASVHKTMPACCRSAVLTFAARDRYQGAGEPGDQIGCPCGNSLIYDYRGWRVAEDVARKVARLRILKAGHPRQDGRTARRSRANSGCSGATGSSNTCACFSPCADSIAPFIGPRTWPGRWRGRE